MASEVTIGSEKLTPHPLRAAILAELHARPFTPIATPARVLHFAFDTSGERAAADRKALSALCRERGLAAPGPADKHHRITLGDATLRWEQHSEFTTYTWELPRRPMCRFSRQLLRLPRRWGWCRSPVR